MIDALWPALLSLASAPFPNGSALGRVDPATLPPAVLVGAALGALIELASLFRGPSVPVALRPSRSLVGRPHPARFDLLRSLLRGLGGEIRARELPAPPQPSRAEEPPPSVPSVRLRTSGTWPDVVSTGLTWFDDLLLGGFPRYGHLVLAVPAGTEGEKVAWATLSAGLDQGQTVVIATASLTVREIAERVERDHPGFTAADRGGRVLWVDASGRGWAAHARPPLLGGPDDYVNILTSLQRAGTEAERRSPSGFRVVFVGVSSVLRAIGELRATAFARNLLGIVRERPALVTYTIESPETDVPAVDALLEGADGTISFRRQDERTYLRVARLAPVESRGWVECRFPDPERLVATFDSVSDAGRTNPDTAGRGPPRVAVPAPSEARPEVFPSFPDSPLRNP